MTKGSGSNFPPRELGLNLASTKSGGSGLLTHYIQILLLRTVQRRIVAGKIASFGDFFVHVGKIKINEGRHLWLLLHNRGIRIDKEGTSQWICAIIHTL